ncbi:helix-turn-helix transcriptional regulator [Micromonospora sp. NPDC003197]
MTRKRLALIERRRAAGYTQEGFATAAGVERTTAYRWEAGDTLPRPWQRPKIAAVLKISLEELDLLLADPDSCPADHNLAHLPVDSINHEQIEALHPPEFLTKIIGIAVGVGANGIEHEPDVDLIPMTCLEPPRQIGLSDVARIELTTRAFRDWDNRWGGDLPRAAIITQLRWVASVTKHSSCDSTKTKEKLLTALADLASAAAFMSYDVNQHTEARKLWTLSLNAAQEAQASGLIGSILRQLTHQALHLKRPADALRFIQLSYAVSATPEDSFSDLALAETALYEGWSYAAIGKAQSCHRSLERAQDYFDSSLGEEVPSWLSHLDHTEMAATRGHAYSVLARSMPAAGEQAERLLRSAVSSRSDNLARSKVLNLVALAGTMFQSNEKLDEATAIADRALDGVAGLTSPRSRDRLWDLEEATRHLKSTGQVAELRHRLGKVLRDD